MFCLRCGRDTGGEQIFCNKCLDSMKQYPIKPGTAVQIPDRQAYFEKHQPEPRNHVSPEELVPQLRRIVRILVAALLVLSVSLGITAWLLIQSISDSAIQFPGNMGRNYTTIERDGE